VVDLIQDNYAGIQIAGEVASPEFSIKVPGTLHGGVPASFDVHEKIQLLLDTVGANHVSGNITNATLTGFSVAQGDVNITGGLTLNNATLTVNGRLNISGGIKGNGSIFATGAITVSGPINLQATSVAAIASEGPIDLRGK
jgi:hypothetical protein